MPDPKPLDDRMTNHRDATRTQLLALLLAVTILASTCGQVITPEPTSTPPPADESTATATGTVAYSTTPGPIGWSGDASTPTVTPTPVEHVVEKGDTLLAIALDFGVSVDALQRANGIEDAQYLQVGQRLVIPIGEEPEDSSPVLLLPTPTPQPIQVQGVAFYETPVGSLLALGEIANTTSLALTNVQVKVVLMGAGGQPLLETDTFAATDIIFPEARSPFSVLFTNPPTDWASYQATIIRGQEAGALAAGVVPLSVIEAEGNPAGPQFQISGGVRNTTSDQVADTVEIFATTYDAQGNVTGYRRVNLKSEEGLAPGDEKAFTVTLDAHGDEPDDFSVTALGRTADE